MENGKNHLSMSQPSKGCDAPEKQSMTGFEPITSQPVTTFSIYKGKSYIAQTYNSTPDSLVGQINQSNEVVQDGTNSLSKTFN
jgi:hypothetical protein